MKCAGRALPGYHDLVILTDWSDVRRRVEALATAPHAGRIFGVLGHGFALEPPLTAAELSDLQEQLGVRLPEEYQGFLRTVGAGGAGPSYGVFPVRRGADGRWAWHGDGGDMTDLSRLAEPFSSTHLRQSDLDRHDEELPEEDEYDDKEKYKKAYDSWMKRYRALFWDPARTVGAVCLCDLGCASRVWLVVSGPERGYMWADYGAEDYDLAPLENPDGTHITFGQWYLDWLNQASRQDSPI